MPEAVLGGTACHWRESGRGAATLLIHSALAHSGMWAGLSPRLTARHLIAPDLPGHGRSGPMDAGRDIHDQCFEMLVGLLENVGADELEVIGHSFGATLALRLALAGLPVKRLVLIEPVLFTAAAPHALQAYKIAAQPQFSAMDEGDWDVAARAFVSDWGDGTPWHHIPSPQRAYIIERMPFVAATSASVLEDRSELLAPGGLEALACPTLLVEGSASPPVISAVHDALAGRIPDARRVIIAGANHMIPVTHAKALSAEVINLSIPL